jgi:hypothetical protein
VLMVLVSFRKNVGWMVRIRRVRAARHGREFTNRTRHDIVAPAR